MYELGQKTVHRMTKILDRKIIIRIALRELVVGTALHSNIGIYFILGFTLNQIYINRLNRPNRQFAK